MNDNPYLLGNPWRKVSEILPCEGKIIDVWIIPSRMFDVFTETLRERRVIDVVFENGQFVDRDGNNIEDHDHKVFCWMNRPLSPIRYGMLNS